MAFPIQWSAAADSTLLALRAAGLPWPAVAAQLHVGRSAVIERARTLGIPSKARLPPAAPLPRPPRIDRPPFPAGHPLTWGAITAGTLASGDPYPLPVFL